MCLIDFKVIIIQFKNIFILRKLNWLNQFRYQKWVLVGTRCIWQHWQRNKQRLHVFHFLTWVVWMSTTHLCLHKCWFLIPFLPRHPAPHRYRRSFTFLHIHLYTHSCHNVTVPHSINRTKQVITVPHNELQKGFTRHSIKHIGPLSDLITVTLWFEAKEQR